MRVATTNNVPISLGKPGVTIDGVVMAENDRILVKDQTNPVENGIYRITSGGGIRTTDADGAGELSGGSTVYVEEGTRNKRRVFTIVTAGSITPGTTSHEWAQLQAKDWGLRESLPTSEAVKGDRCSYVADKTNGVVWELIYDGEGEYPWKKVGGGKLYIRSKTNVTGVSATSFTSFAEACKLTTPLKGDYDCEWGAALYGESGTNAILGLVVDGSSPSYPEGDDVAFGGGATGGAGFPGSRTKRATAVGASKVIEVKYRVSSGSSGQLRSPFLRIDPVRVG